RLPAKSLTWGMLIPMLWPAGKGLSGVKYIVVWSAEKRIKPGRAGPSYWGLEPGTPPVPRLMETPPIHCEETAFEKVTAIEEFGLTLLPEGSKRRSVGAVSSTSPEVWKV